MLLRRQFELERRAMIEPHPAEAHHQSEQRAPQPEPAVGLAHPSHEGQPAANPHPADITGGRIDHQVSLHSRTRLW